MPFDPDTEILPQELFGQIIECARDDKHALLNLCLVSKSFLSESRHFLYQRVFLGGVKVIKARRGAWGISINTDNIFFTVLANTPYLAHYVRELSYRPGSCYKGDRFWSVFCQAFHQMVNLKCLSLTLMTGDTGFFKELYGHPFQLEVFILRDYRHGLGDDYMAHFSSFISSQPQLQTIEILSPIPSLPVPTQSCQKLTTFIGDITLALPLLRSCPIMNYVWRGGLLHTPTSSDDELALSRLRVLIFHNYFPVMDCQQLANCLKSLEVLKIMFTSDMYGDIATSATALVLNLAKLKKLRVLVWAGLDISEGNGGTFRELVPDFFEGATALKYVYYSDREPPGEPYLRWERGKPLPVQVEVDESSYFCRALGDGVLSGELK